MPGFKLLSYADQNGAPCAGLLVGGTVHDVQAELRQLQSAVPARVEVMHVLQNWDTLLPILTQIAERPSAIGARPLAEVSLLAPVPQPGVLYCAGANYYDHVKEMSNNDVDKTKVEPVFFIKASSCVIGPGEPIRLPQNYSEKYDWEIEVAAVVGRKARNLEVSSALSCIAGYTILNDLSARDRGWRQDWKFGMDWMRHKSWDTAAPMGPWITPANDIADVQKLRLKTTISGEVMQDSSTAQMIFSVAELVAAISRQITLRPGDVIATGTCAGVGNARGRFLVPADNISMEIEGLGTLSNPVAKGD